MREIAMRFAQRFFVLVNMYSRTLAKPFRYAVVKLINLIYQ